MNKAMFGKFFLSILGLIAIVSPLSAAPVFTLSLFNVDDILHATITNSAFTNVEFLVANMSDASTDFSSFVRSGTNTLGLRLESDHGGYTYGYDFKIDGVTADSGSCGTKGVVGCNNNDPTVGTAVFTHSFTFQGDGTSGGGGSATPEPSAAMLSAFGLVPVAILLRRKRSKA